MQLLNVWQLPWMAYSICHRRSELQLLGAVLAYCPPKPGLLLVTRRLRLFKIFFFQKLLLNAPFVASLILCFGGKVCLLQVWSTHGHKQHRPRLQALHLLYKLGVLPRDHPLVRPKQSVELCARSLSSEMPNFSPEDGSDQVILRERTCAVSHSTYAFGPRPCSGTKSPNSSTAQQPLRRFVLRATWQHVSPAALLPTSSYLVSRPAVAGWCSGTLYQCSLLAGCQEAVGAQQCSGQPRGFGSPAEAAKSPQPSSCRVSGRLSNTASCLKVIMWTVAQCVQCTAGPCWRSTGRTLCRHTQGCQARLHIR